MAVMTTDLGAYADNGLSTTYSLSTSTFRKPQLVTVARKPPKGDGKVNETELRATFVTEDSEGNVLPERCLINATLRQPINGSQADFDLALATFRDIVNSDEFTAVVATGNELK